MMTGIPIENNLWTAYLLTIFFVVAGFAVYDVLYRRVPDRALVFFIPLALYAVFCSGHNFTPLLHLELDTILAFCPFTIQFQAYPE